MRSIIIIIIIERLFSNQFNLSIKRGGEPPTTLPYSVADHIIAGWDTRRSSIQFPPSTGEFECGIPLHREEKPASRMRKNPIYLSARNTHR
jgi:hypothetical protein